MKVSIFPSWLHVTTQTAIATANKLPAFNKKNKICLKIKNCVLFVSRHGDM